MDAPASVQALVGTGASADKRLRTGSLLRATAHQKGQAGACEQRGIAHPACCSSKLAPVRDGVCFTLVPFVILVCGAEVVWVVSRRLHITGAAGTKALLHDCLRLVLLSCVYQSTRVQALPWPYCSASTQQGQ
jgi:hypothetical protein